MTCADVKTHQSVVMATDVEARRVRGLGAGGGGNGGSRTCVRRTGGAVHDLHPCAFAEALHIYLSILNAYLCLFFLFR